ncbi:hypothetical protein Hanom_Chr05g00455381 [Helianthus anomalus]
MWSCMIDGYTAPTRQVDGRILVISYEKMDEYGKQIVDAEKRALAMIKKSLPMEISYNYVGM